MGKEEITAKPANEKIFSSFSFLKMEAEERREALGLAEKFARGPGNFLFLSPLGNWQKGDVWQKERRPFCSEGLPSVCKTKPAICERDIFFRQTKTLSDSQSKEMASALLHSNSQKKI